MMAWHIPYSAIRLQVEDVTIFGPFKTWFNAAMTTIVKMKVVASAGRGGASLGPEDFNAAIEEPWKLAHGQARICEGFAQTGFHPATRCVYWQQRASELAALAKSSPDRQMLTAQLNSAAEASVAEIARAHLRSMRFNDAKKFQAAAPLAALPTAEAEALAGADDEYDDAVAEFEDDGHGAEGDAQPQAAGAEPRAKRPFQPWAVAGGAATPEVIAYYTAIEENKAETERKKEANKQARAQAHTARVDAGKALLADPALSLSTLSREKCQQVLTALGVKVPEKNPVVATLREEVRKALLVHRATVAAHGGIGAADAALLPRGLLME
jgi:hypothetical protein